MKKKMTVIGTTICLVFCVTSCGNLMNDMLSEILAGLNTSLFAVHYDGNGETGGSVPVDENSYLEGQEITVHGNTGGLEKVGYAFFGWNTAADGSGTGCAENDTLLMGTGDMTLYAQWTSTSVAVTGVVLSRNSSVLSRGYTQQLSATVSPSNATNKTITWSSSDTDVITVDANGLVEAVDGGSATVLVTTGDGGHTDACVVEVITPPSTEIQKLLASDGSNVDYFGCSVAMYKDTAVIGARLAGVSSGPGAAYVFERDHTGVWTETAKLTASDGAPADYFGHAVAITDKKIIVSARGDDDNGDASGSAYIFEQDPAGNWTERSKITASDGSDGDNFGESVAISGNFAIVGAFHDAENGSESGSAYIFTRTRAGWSQETKITPLDGAENDLFGHATVITGHTAFISSPNRHDGNANGAVYIFERNAAQVWKETAILTTSDDLPDEEHFGKSIALSGDTLLIGAWLDDVGGSNSGSAYVFEQDGFGKWNETEKLFASDGAASDYFGKGAALSGNYAVLGASRDDHSASDSGSAYVYERDPAGTWNEAAKLTASDGAIYDFFGDAVAIAGGCALIGAPQEDENGTHSGAVYVFE